MCNSVFSAGSAHTHTNCFIVPLLILLQWRNGSEAGGWTSWASRHIGERAWLNTTTSSRGHIPPSPRNTPRLMTVLSEKQHSVPSPVQPCRCGRSGGCYSESGQNDLISDLLPFRYRFMAMDRLGSDLQKVFEKSGGRMKKPTVLLLGQTLVRSDAGWLLKQHGPPAASSPFLVLSLS